MLTGKRFRLERGTLAVEGVEGAKQRAVTVPVGAVIKVLAGPTNNNGLVKIDWDGRTLGMFSVDVDVRGTEIQD